MFARAWVRWIGKRGGASAVDPYRYLDHAEPFVQQFLAALEEHGPQGAELMSGSTQVRGPLAWSF